MTDVYDVVVYGASGFTGRYVARQLARRAGKRTDLRCALAGRSRPRLAQVQSEVRDEFGVQFDVIVADASAPQSIHAMVNQCKLVIACVGPFRHYGEPVVASCAKLGKLYVDITGETEWLERMQLTYFQQARDKGACIVHACGFDSIPADMGTLHATRTAVANGVTPVAIDSVLNVNTNGKGCPGNVGTWRSLVDSLGGVDTLRKQRKVLHRMLDEIVAKDLNGQEAMVQSEEEVAREKALLASVRRRDPKKPQYDQYYKTWVAPFPGTDSAAVRDSQRMRRKIIGSDDPLPVYGAYVNIGSLFYVVLLGVAMMAWSLLARFEVTRQAMLKHVGLFTLGFFSLTGPTPEQVANTSFTMDFVTHAATPGASECDVMQRTCVTAPDPGYVATSMLLVEAGLTLLDQRDRVPAGVLTPSAAFARTDLIQRLCDNTDVKFDVVSRNVLNE